MAAQCPDRTAGRGSPASNANNLDLLHSSSVTRRARLSPYVTAPPAGSVCFLSTLFSPCLSEPWTATRPGPPGRCLRLVRGGPPRAVQPGWEISIPQCCIADILSHHLLRFCRGRVEEGEGQQKSVFTFDSFR